MPYYLDTQLIKAPTSLKEKIDNQYAENRTLNGSIHRDYFGDLKRVWTLNFNNLNKTDYFTIRAIYNDYLTNFVAKAWEITENNYTILATTVHLNLDDRSFSVGGSDYLSDVTLVLTEA